MKRRVFFEIKLHSWIVRHDINGDGLLIKTINQRGNGIDRPFALDEVLVDFCLYQGRGENRKVLL